MFTNEDVCQKINEDEDLIILLMLFSLFTYKFYI